MGQQVLSEFHPQDNYSRDLVSHFDVAARANTEARCNAPPHQSELNETVLATVPGYLEFKAHRHT